MHVTQLPRFQTVSMNPTETGLIAGYDGEMPCTLNVSTLLIKHGPTLHFDYIKGEDISCIKHSSDIIFTKNR